MEIGLCNVRCSYIDLLKKRHVFSYFTLSDIHSGSVFSRDGTDPTFSKYIGPVPAKNNNNDNNNK